MIEAPTPLTVLRHATEIIKARGWAAHWSYDDESPLNIRSAVSRSVTELVGISGGRTWHDLYVGSVGAVTQHLKRGITEWEFTVKTSSEAEAMLTEVANRMENGEIKPLKRPRRPASGV